MSTHGNGRGIYRTAGSKKSYTQDRERAVIAYDQRARLKVGDIVKRPWRHNKSSDPAVYKMGVVIYVHPQGYYHTVQFITKSGAAVNEAFHGVRQ